jgi:hypothetical protein
VEFNQGFLRWIKGPEVCLRKVLRRSFFDAVPPPMHRVTSGTRPHHAPLGS